MKNYPPDMLLLEACGSVFELDGPLVPKLFNWLDHILNCLAGPHSLLPSCTVLKTAHLYCVESGLVVPC